MLERKRRKKSFAIRAFHLRHEDNKFRLTFLLSRPQFRLGTHRYPFAHVDNGSCWGDRRNFAALNKGKVIEEAVRAFVVILRVR